MKKNITAIAMLFVIALTACAQQKKTTASSSLKADEKNKGGITGIKMQRTPCFGKCPSYTIEFNSEGKATYTGESNVTYMGTYEGTIDKSVAKQLLDKFNSYRADTCQDEYQMYISDVPGINYGFMVNGQKKNIRHANFGPEFLKTLATEIDAKIAPNKSWKKTAEEVKQ